MLINNLIENIVNNTIILFHFSENNLDFRKINYKELKLLMNNLMD